MVDELREQTGRGAAHLESRAEHREAVGPPASVTHTWINLCGLATGMIAMAALWRSELALVDQTVLILVASFTPIVVLDLCVTRVHRRATAGFDWDRRKALDLPRVGVKLLGLTATLSAIGALYLLLPEYADGFYQISWSALARYGPYLIVPAVIYFCWADMHMREPRDGYWLIGQICLGRRPSSDRKAILVEYLRGWLIKAFFLPIMFAALVYTLGDFHRVAGGDIANHLVLYEAAWLLTFVIDLIFTCAGYMLTIRVLDAHIRTTEPTVLGWLAALICYRPFWDPLYNNYLAYDSDGLTWGPWLAGLMPLQIFWGTMIIAALAIYAWATVTFGCRFSNLTHRGILTNGPYRFTKHPAYVAKNLSWWLIAVPFVATQGWLQAATGCALLLLVNAIYLIRARTEERHLSWDPDYVAYALWIEEHGVFRHLGRLIPALRYTVPQGAPQPSRS